MFIGAFDAAAAWSEDGVKGCRRFLERVWKLKDMVTDEEGYSADLETKMHQTIKKVSNDFETLKYNTAIDVYKRQEQPISGRNHCARKYHVELFAE